MTWLAPLGFWALLALPALLWWRLFGARRRGRRVGALLLWERALADRPAGTGRQWPPPGLLALELAALAAGALALAHPAWLSPTSADAVLVVLDRTASMAATDESGGSAWSRALDAMAHRLGEWPEETRFTLRCVPPLDQGPVSGDRHTVLAAARGATPADTGGDPLAATALGAHSAVVLFTDRLPPLPAGDPLEVHAVGQPAENVACTHLHIEADGRCFVAWARRAPLGTPVEALAWSLDLDGTELSGPAVALPAQGEVGVSVALPPAFADARRLAVRRTGADALAADDTARVERQDVAPLRVDWVGADAPTLRRAIRAALGPAVTVAPPEPGTRPALTVVHRETPDVLPAGPVLVVDPPGAVGGIPWAAGSARARPAGPLAGVWEGIGLAAAAPVATGWCPSLPRGAVVHLAAPEGAVGLQVSRAGGDVWVVGWPASDQQFELTPAYPVFFGRVLAALVPPAARTGWSTHQRALAEVDCAAAETATRPGARVAHATTVDAVQSGQPWLAWLAVVLLGVRLTRRP